jgi:hypothetical protein
MKENHMNVNTFYHRLFLGTCACRHAWRTFREDLPFAGNSSKQLRQRHRHGSGTDE